MNRIPPATPFALASLASLDAAEARLDRAFDATRRTPADLGSGDRPQWAAAYAAADVAYEAAYAAREVARSRALLLGV